MSRSFYTFSESLCCERYSDKSLLPFRSREPYARNASGIGIMIAARHLDQLSSVYGFADKHILFNELRTQAGFLPTGLLDFRTSAPRKVGMLLQHLIEALRLLQQLTLLMGDTHQPNS